MTCLIVLLLFFITITTSAYAAWVGPVEVITGKWGTAVGEFGFKSGNPEDGFPRQFLVGDNQIIIVSDYLNKRVQVVTPGADIKPFGSKNLNLSWEPKTWPSKKIANVGDQFVEAGFGKVQIYEYDGTLQNEFKVESGRFRGIDNNSRIVLYDKSSKNFKTYSIAGALQETNEKEPLGLGIEKSSRMSNGKHTTTIAYNDSIFTVETPIRIKNITRDQNGYLYGFGLNGTYKKIQKRSYRVYKFDSCSNPISQIDFPFDRTEIIVHGAGSPREETEVVYLEQYGAPVIAPNGDIYTWKRTPETYNILRWEWVDDPSDPKRDCPK